MKKQISWINTARTLCIIAIYLRHSEIYYEMTEDTSLLSDLFTPFRVVIFFFISGYLFFKKRLTPTSLTESQEHKGKDYISALKHLMFRLAIPTILFASFIYIPKCLFHDSGLSLSQYMYDVVGGTSYWFTSALTVAQVILLTLIFITKTHILRYLFLSAVFMMVGIYLGEEHYTAFPWHWQSALVATFFLCLGGTYQRYENKIDQWLKPYGALVMTIAYFVLIFSGTSIETMIAPIKLNTLGMATILLGLGFIISISKWLPDLKKLNYIGQHTITFYFFSGVMPALFSSILHQLHNDVLPHAYIIVAIMSLCASFVTTYIINTKLAFLLDLRRLKKGV